MPAPRISSQPVPLQTEQPTPPQTPHWTSISADGSVNGKKLGRKRDLTAPKNRRANRFNVAFKSTKLIPSSTQRPSIWANAGACDASKKSRRYTVPGIRTRIGGGYFCKVRTWTGEVWGRHSTSSSRDSVSWASRAGWFGGKFNASNFYHFVSTSGPTALEDPTSQKI